MRVAQLGLLAFVLLDLSGCATFVDGDRQLIAISTPPTQAAQCILTRPGGRWTVTTPGVVRIEKSSDDITIRCSRPGFQDGYATIPSEIAGWTFGNIAIGVLPAGIDAATGAMFSYPNAFAVRLTPGGSVATAQPFAPLPDSQAPAPPPARPSGTPLPGTLPDNF